jgi:chromosomal replication initiator protein
MLQREKIKSLIKINYFMIKRLEVLLDDIEVKIKPKYCEGNFIIETVNNEFNTDCREQTRRKKVVFARHAACFFLREYTKMTLEDIANSLGNKDHSTVINSIKVFKNLVETDDDYKNKIENIRLDLEKKY